MTPPRRERTTPSSVADVQPASGSRGGAALWCFIVFAAVCASFWPATSQGFIALDDDYNFLTQETAAWRGLSLEHLGWMWTTPWLGHWQPLSWMTLALDYSIAGGKEALDFRTPNAFTVLGGQIHLTNILMHAAGAIVLFFVARRLLALALRGSQRALDSKIDLAAAAAALFYALHPLRVESVAWATERRDVQSGLCLFASLCCYLKRRDGGSARWIAASIGFFALSLLSKAWGMTYPAVLLAIDVFPLRRLRDPNRASFVTLIAEKVVFIVLAIACAITAAWAQHSTLATTPWSEHGFVQRVAQSSYGLCFYVAKTIWPSGLSPLYILERDLDPSRSIYVASMLAVLAAGVLAVLFRKRIPGLVVALVVYVAVVSPVLGMLQSGAQKVADRYTYLACVPFALLFGALCARLAERRTALAYGAFIPLALFGAMSWRQTQLWGDSERLWRRVVEVEPDNYFGQHDLAAQLRLRGDRAADATERKRCYEEAIEHELASVRAHPGIGNEPARHDLGALYNLLGRTDEAVGAWRACLDVSPDNEPCLDELRRYYTSRNSLDSWRALLEELISRAPTAMAPRDRLAELWLAKGDKAKAEEVARAALGANPSWQPSWALLGRILLETNRVGDAEPVLRNAIALNGYDFESWVNLGRALRAAHRKDEAEACWEQVLAYQPNHAAARALLEKSRAEANGQK